MLKHGSIGRGWQIIDANLVAALKQHNSCSEKALLDQGALLVDWKQAKRRQKDIYATWTKKHGKSTFSCKLSISVDKKYKLIRKIETESASMLDSSHFDSVLDSHNTSRDVSADWGYPSEYRKAWLKENGFRNHIQRKGKCYRPLSDCEEQRNKRITKHVPGSNICS